MDNVLVAVSISGMRFLLFPISSASVPFYFLFSPPDQVREAAEEHGTTRS